VNNAGVSSPGSPWETTIDDWNWVMGVNLWGVIYGIRAFMPTMIRQQSPCHIVNTASAAGLVYGNGPATYATTKHAVVGLTEDLYFHVNRRGLDIGVSVLCPGLISTNIVDSARNRPVELSNRFEPGTSEQRTLNQARLAEAMQTAMTPAELAEIVFAAIADRRLYIQTGESNEIILARARHITSGSNP
jgi:NAD(P)-dependent dehydrogenase (short-subunit alcohol dehydrogenase family)